MAEKVVKSSDIIEDDVFRPTRESAEKTLPVLLKMQEVFESFLKATKENVKGPGGLGGLKPEEYDETLAKVKEVAKAHLKLKEDIVRTQAQVAAAYDEESKALRDNKVELEAARLARNELNKEARQAAILAKAEEGSLEMLRVKLSQATKALDAMSAATLKTQRGMEQITLVKNLNQQISEVEQASGRFQRNVGNYKSATDGLSMSIAQITRETPSAAISLNTYFMAISNNLPMFADQIKKIRDANIELTKSGQPTISVLGAIAKGFFSWQTLLSAAITLLTIYGSKLFDYITGTKEAAKTQDEFNKTLEEANKQYESLAERAEAARIRAAVASGRMTSTEGQELDLRRKFIAERAKLNEDERNAILKINTEQLPFEQLEKEKQDQITQIQNLYNTARIHLQEEYQYNLEQVNETAHKDFLKRQDERNRKRKEQADKAAKDRLDAANKEFEAMFNLESERMAFEGEMESKRKEAEDEAFLNRQRAQFAENEEWAKWNEEQSKAEEDARKKASDKEKKDRENRIKAEQQAFDQLNKSLQTYYDRREYLLDKTIDNSKRRQDELRTLAALGVQDAKDSLATEQKVQAEAEQKKLELERKKARAELGTAAFKSYTAHVENGDKNAVAATIKDIVMLSAFIQSLPAFYEGTENTGTGGGLDGKGGFLSVLHPNERVMTAEQNGMVGSLSNIELANLAQMYNMGLVAPKVTYESDRTDAVIHELRSVKEAIKSIDIPAQKVYFDETTKALVNVVETRTKVIKTHHKTGGIWG
mgnify:CR=1 FL=1